MKSTAGVLADYFLKKGLQQSSDEVSESDDTSDWTADIYLDAEKTQYNVRKLIELPHCLKRSGRTDELKELLFSYVWLKAKLTSLSCSDVIEDFSAICPVVPVNRNEEDSNSLYELRLLRDALTLCAYSCNVDPDSFPQQLCGRLMPFVRDEFTRLSLKKLVTAALADSNPPLLMPFRSLQRTPGGPLLTVMNGHRDVISGVSATLVKKSSGKVTLSIVTSSWDRTLKSWDLDSGGVLKTFDGHEDKVLSVSLTGDGQFVASGSADRTARFWCVSDARCLHVLQGHTAEVNSVAVTIDGTRSVSASSDCSIKVWNTDNTSSSCGELIYTMDGHGRSILTLSLSQNTILASGDSGGIVLVTDIISGAILYRLKGSGAITALSTAEIDGVKCLLIGTGSGQSVVKELESGRSIKKFSCSAGEKGSAITAMAATPDGKVIISNKDKLLSVWDVRDGTFLHSFTGHQDELHAMAIADNGHLILTGSADSSLLVWDLLRPPVVSCMSHPPGATSVYLSPCGTYGVSGGTDSAVKVYDMKTMEVVREIRSGNSDKAISQVLIQRDSEHVVVGYSDGAVEYWNGLDQTLLTTCKDTPPSSVSCIDLSPDGQLIMAGYVDSTISCWSTKTGEKLKTLTNHSAPITAASFCHDQILTASTDAQVDIRCYRTTKLTSSHRIHEEGLLCLSVSPNSKFFVSGTRRGACHVTDMKTGLFKTVLVGHRGPVTCVQVLQDFVHCLTVSEQGCIRMWDLESGSCISRLYVDGTVTSCCANMHFGGLIYGTDEGWVSAALYWTDSGPDKAEFEGVLTTGLQSSWTSSSDDTNNSSVSGSRQTLTG